MSVRQNVSEVAADGASAVQLTATLTDHKNHIITGAPIVFSASNGGNNLISPVSRVTNNLGQARAAFASTSVGLQTLRATRNVTSVKTTASFTCAGAFLSSDGWPYATLYPYEAAAADMNNDGTTDIITVSNNQSLVSLLFGNGNGSFQAPVEYTVSRVAGVNIGDLNADGNLDIAATDFNNNRLGILIGTGAGAFLPVVFYSVGGGPNGVAFADFNGDSNLDVAVANGVSTYVSVLFGNGDGTLQAASSYTTGGNWTSSIAAGDLNKDGKIDLVTANFASNTSSVLLNSGSGTFPTGTAYAAVNYPHHVVIADFNGDNNLDWATANWASNIVSIFRNNAGSGTSPTISTFATITAPTHLSVGDINGDDKMDLVVGSGSSFFSNRSGPHRSVRMTPSGPKKIRLFCSDVIFAVANGTRCRHRRFESSVSRQGRGQCSAC